MATIKHILFPYDFSDQSKQAIPFVRAIANVFEARVTLLSVIPPVWTPPPLGMAPLVAAATPSVARELDARLDQLAKEEMPTVKTATAAVGGDPAYKIVEFAEDNAADLIMMPTHGCGLFRSMLIGSVTSKVLHDAKCPVWTATHAEEQQSREMPRTILCAIDGGPRTVELLQWACRFSQRLGADLRVLHVVAPISDWLALPSERELQEEVRDEARKNIEALQESAGVAAPLRVAVGKISETITEEARQEGADLVLIGRGAAQAAFGRLRTHVHSIIQSSPCPVLSV
jgi:nucleotide-binding universal stress UspA family protein